MFRRTFSNKWIIALGVFLVGIFLLTLTGSFQPGNSASVPASAGSASPDSQAESDSTATPAPPYKPVTEPQVIKAPAGPVPQQVIIRFAPETTEEQRQEYIESVGGTVVETIASLDTVVVTLPEETAEEPLPESPLVEESEPDYFVSALDDTFIPNDPRYAEQWALPAIGAPVAWAQIPADAPAVTVAVIDSGICASHPDLSGRIEAGWDFLEDDAVPQDDFGHGCSVAGVIAANTNNGVGIAGVAPNAQIMPLRVLNASGVGSYSDVAAAIVYAADHGAQVINLSLGGSNPSSTLENAVNYAIDKGVIVVAAAGNNGTEGALYPAAYEPVIAVGSVDPNLEHSSFSNYGPQVDIWAPGRDILTTKRDGSYGLVSGTSFAAPYVAGAEIIDIVLEKDLSVDGGLLIVMNGAGVETTVPPIPTTPAVTPTQTITDIPSPTPDTNQARLKIYRDTEFGFAFLYPENAIYISWEPVSDILSTKSFFLAGWNDTSQTLPLPEVSVTIFSNPDHLSVIDWQEAHTLSSRTVDPNTVGNSAAVFTDAGLPATLFIDGRLSIIFLHIVDGIPVARLLVGHDKNIISITMTHFDLGMMKDTFLTIASSFKFNTASELTLDQQLDDELKTILSGLTLPVNSSTQGIGPAAYTGYKLPWPSGISYYVSQNWGTPEPGVSHYGYSLYAYDFGMPGGRSVSASRTGKVVIAKGDSPDTTAYCGGQDKASLGNRIVMNHSDGKASLYLHLMSTSVNVDSKNDVPQGTVIGKSGRTGWTDCGYHLHFQVQNQGSWWEQSQEFYFDEYPGTQLQWSNGNITYKSQNQVPSSSNNPPSGFTWCANEGGRCNFSGTADVVYGALNSFTSPRSFTNGVDCNNSVFGDPIYGTSKACYYKLTSPPPSCPQSGGVILYWNANYDCGNGEGDAGYRLRSGTGWQNVTDGSFNDKASSVRVPSGWSVMLYEHGDRQGAKVCYNTNVSDLGTKGNFPGTSVPINDHVSSMEVFSDTTCGGAAVPPAPSLSSPGNGSSNSYNYDLTFQWNSVSGATSYLIEWWGGPYSTMQPCGWSSSTSCHIGTVAQGYTYYWHVKARNSYGESSWSSTWSFSIQTQPTAPSAPTLSSPGNGSSNPYNYDLTFQWNSVSGATSYLIEWWGGPYSTMQPCGWSSSTSCHIGTIAPGYTYYWHVKARNSYGESGWSSTWSFTIQPAPLPDLVPYPRPGASDPVVVSRSANWPYTEELISGQTAYYYWGYKNIGQSNAGAHHVKVYVDNQQFIDYPFSGLGAGNLGGFDNWSEGFYVAPGPHTVKIVVDANGEVNESNESNNTWTGTVYWRDPKVVLDSVFTTDDLGPAGMGEDNTIPVEDLKPSAYKDTFNPGDPIWLYLEFTNEFLNDRTFTGEWQVINPAGRVVPELSYTGTTTLGAGGWWWWINRTIPTYSLRGQYTFIGKITYNGVTSTKTHTFTVTGPPTVEVYDVFVADENGNATSLEAIPQRSVPSDVEGNSVPTFNAGDGIRLYIDTYNDVAEGESATFEWEVIDPWGRTIDALHWYGDLNSGLGRTRWSLSPRIPGNAVTGDYTFTGYITHGDRTTYQSQTFHVNGPAGPSNDNFSTPVVISGVPYTGTKDTWGATTATTDPTPTCGSGKNSNSVWYKYTAPANGLLEVDTWGSDYDTVLAIWKGTSPNLTLVDCNDDIYGDLQAWLEGTPVTAGTTYYIEVMDYGNPGGGNLELYVDFAQSVSNDDFGSPTVISAMPYNLTKDVRGATKAFDDPALTQCNRLPGQASVWYRYTATGDGNLELDTKGSDYDTMLAVWTGTRGNLTSVGCNDDIGYVGEDWDSDSILTVPVTNGTTYYIEVSTYDGMIDVNGESAGALQAKEAGKNEKGESGAHGLQDKKAAVDEGEKITGQASKRSDEMSAQFWGGQMKLNTSFVSAVPQLKSPTIGTILNRTDNVSLNWSTSGTSCTVHVWGGNTDITTPPGNCSNLVLGQQPGGSYSWQVTSNNEKGSVVGPVWTFNIRPYGPTNLTAWVVSPTQVNLSWSLSSDEPLDVDGYDIFKNGIFLASVPKGTSTYSVTGITCNLNNSFYVRAKRQGVPSENSNLVSLIAPCSPNAFNKLTPGNATIGHPNNVKLSWSISSGAVTYEYCYDKTNDNLCDGTWESTSSTNAILPDLDYGTTYYWQVRSKNVSGVTDANKGVWWSFKIKPDSPILLLPGVTSDEIPNILTRRPTFTWQAVSGATGYTIQVSKDNTFTSLVAIYTLKTTDTQYTHTADLPANAKLYWRIRANSPYGLSSWSQIHAFITGNPPTTPVLLAPLSNALTNDFTPTLDWLPCKVPAGTTFSHYQIQVDSNQGFPNPIVDADVDGLDNHAFTLPDEMALSPATTYYWRVRAWNAGKDAISRDDDEYSAWSATQKLRTSYLPPVLLTPGSVPAEVAPNVHMRRPTFDWEDVPGATGYTIQVGKNNAFTALVATYTVNTPISNFTPVTDLPANSTLYWRVRANGPNGPSLYSDAHSFMTGNPPSVPGLLLPANNALTANYRPRLDWSNATLPAGTGFDKYELQIVDNVAFDTPTVVDIPGQVNSEYTPNEDLLPNTKYYWRVRSWNTDGDYSAWSPVFAFRTAIEKPVLINPTGGILVGGLRPALEWNACAGATGYTIQVSRNVAFTSLVVSVSTKTLATSYTPTINLPSNVPLWWRVRANGLNGPSLWSDVETFRTP